MFGSIGQGRTKSIARRGGNEFFRNHLVRSFKRPKGKTLLIASRIDSSKVGRGRRRRTLSPSFAPSIDQMRFLRDHSRRFSKDFRMPPPTPPPKQSPPPSPAGAFSPH